MKKVLTIIFIFGLFVGIIAGSTALIRNYLSSNSIVTEISTASSSTTVNSGSTGDVPFEGNVDEIIPEVITIYF